MGLTEQKKTKTSTPKVPKAKPVVKKKRKRGHSLSPVEDEDISMDVAGMQEAKEAIQESIAAKELDRVTQQEMEMDEQPKKLRGDHGTGAAIQEGRLVNKEGKELDYMKLYEKKQGSHVKGSKKKKA